MHNSKSKERTNKVRINANNIEGMDDPVVYVLFSPSLSPPNKREWKMKYSL